MTFDWVSKQLPDYPWTYARTGTLARKNFDICDAYCCALFAPKRYRLAKSERLWRMAYMERL